MEGIKLHVIEEFLNDTVRALPHWLSNVSTHVEHEDDHETAPYTVLFIFTVLLVGGKLGLILSP